MTEVDLRKCAERLVHLLIIDLRENPRVERAVAGINTVTWQEMVDGLYERAADFLRDTFGTTD